MSRCFKFPPPGYEKKLTPEEADLLKEEKKHKKDKKEKEKREGKEKRDKDRSDGKHREKKEKKDKHRDKKEKHKDKKKDKDKDKEKSSISEEARVAIPPGASSGGKLHEIDEHKDRHISSEKAKLPDQFHVRHGEKPFKTSLSAVEAENSKFVQELGRRIRDEETGAQSQLAERFPVEWKRDEKSDRVGIKVIGNLAEDKEQNKEKGSNNNKMDVQAFRGEHKIGANAIPPSLSAMAKSNSEGIPRPLEENVGKKREEKQKPKERRDEKPREKNKDKEREKHSHGKHKDKEKEKKKEEKVKDKSEHKKSQEDKSEDNKKNGFVVLSNNNKLPLVSKENIAGTVTEGIVKKRKNVESNGFLHESEVRPAKLLRPSSSQQPTQNGKKLDTQPKTDLFSSIKQGVATDTKVESKEQKVNGSVEGEPLFSAKAKIADQIAEASKKPLFSVKAKASSVIPGADQIAEASKRPHPDSKYLIQILSVPKMDDWSGFDDQEWLLGSKRTLAKDAEMCPDEVSKEHCVWSEALQIDPADVCALPYVIPY
ncbi:hypothetical protein K7X08_016814 [Anisodus acutangulus]|uniref:Uncharacterized protein n=1 Tax=Anisodus acutangulus TaxID=402998 RepID=A0A9Q1LPU0_9SOLA|nr:hypothetical protein K7X08_016814 [Anisodus acutangulus]